MLPVVHCSSSSAAPAPGESFFLNHTPVAGGCSNAQNAPCTAANLTARTCCVQPIMCHLVVAVQVSVADGEVAARRRWGTAFQPCAAGHPPGEI